MGPELPCTQTPRSAPEFPRQRPCCELRPVAAPVRRQASAARCIISNLYRALKGIQRSNWEALKLKWGWDLESTLELAVWREAWGSISSVLISGEPNINVFWRFYSSSPGVYMRVGFLFIFFPSSSPLLLFFLHSEASSKCNCRRGALSQRLGQHLSACSAAARPRHPHSRHPTPVTPLPAVALPGSRGRTAVVPIGSHLVLLHCQRGAISTGTRCRWAEESQEVPTAAPALSPPA